MLDQDNNLYPISYSILATCLLNSVWILWEEVYINHFRELKVEGLGRGCEGELSSVVVNLTHELTAYVYCRRSPYRV